MAASFSLLSFPDWIFLIYFSLDISFCYSQFPWYNSYLNEVIFREWSLVKKPSINARESTPMLATCDKIEIQLPIEIFLFQTYFGRRYFYHFIYIMIIILYLNHWFLCLLPNKFYHNLFFLSYLIQFFHFTSHIPF